MRVFNWGAARGGHAKDIEQKLKWQSIKFSQSAEYDSVGSYGRDTVPRLSGCGASRWAAPHGRQRWMNRG